MVAAAWRSRRWRLAEIDDGEGFSAVGADGSVVYEGHVPEGGGGGGEGSGVIITRHGPDDLGEDGVWWGMGEFQGVMDAEGLILVMWDR